MDSEHDAYERQAQRMEDRQGRRWDNSTLEQKVQFWTKTECETFDTIKMLRAKSKTYQAK